MVAATTAIYPSSLAAWAIEAYQRFVSPYKGFRCAHRAVHGRDSCSQFAKRVALKRGLLALFPLLRRRFTECGVAAQVLDYESREQRRRRLASDNQRKSSPLDGCDPCAVDCGTPGGCDGVAGAIDVVTAPADCAGVGADCLSGADCGAADCGGADCGGADCASCDVF